MLAGEGHLASGGVVAHRWREMPAGAGQRLQLWEGIRRGTTMGLPVGRSARRGPRGTSRGQGPAALRGTRAPVPGLGRGVSTYLYHGGWVLKAWSHRWQGPAAGESSSAPLVPGPRAHRACRTKGHSEEDLKGEGRGRAGQT